MTRIRKYREVADATGERERGREREGEGEGEREGEGDVRIVKIIGWLEVLG